MRLQEAQKKKAAMANCLKRFGELKDNSDFLSLAKKLILSLNSKSIFF